MGGCAQAVSALVKTHKKLRGHSFDTRPLVIMLCYVMLCYVIVCYVMLCYVMFCHHTSSCVMEVTEFTVVTEVTVITEVTVVTKVTEVTQVT